MRTVFITGTDTDIGKTYVSCLLLRELHNIGFKTFSIKPLASGCENNPDSSYLINDDALHLQMASSINKPYKIVNPIALKDPIAPHIAAKNMNIQLSKVMLREAIVSSLQNEADITVIEGVGGWAVPLNDHELISDVIAELKLPVILVVGIKLGCLNHALLTYKALIKANIPFIGWIANCVSSSTLCIEENIETLRCLIDHPCLGVIPHNNQELGCINIDIIKNYLFQ